jgi:hypothetical protein
VGIGKCLAEIAAQYGALRLERRGDLQILQTFLRMTFANPDQTAAEPGIGQSPVHRNRTVKPRQRLLRFVLRIEHESLQGQSLSVTGGKFQSFVQRRERLRRAVKACLQFRHANPGRPEAGRQPGRCVGRGQCLLQFRLRLQRVGSRHPPACGRRRARRRPRLPLHRADDFTQCVGDVGGRGDSVQAGLSLGNLPDGQQQRRLQEALRIGDRRAIFRKRRSGRDEVSGAIGVQRIAERLFLLVRQFQIIGRDDRGIIEGPLDDVDRVDERRVCRRATGINDTLLPAFQRRLAQGIGQLDFTVEERNHRSSIVRDGKIELSATNRPRGDRSAELNFLRLLPTEEVRRA